MSSSIPSTSSLFGRGLLAAVSVAGLAAIPGACGGGGANGESTKFLDVGGPCTPMDESSAAFAGGSLQEASIVQGAGCATSVCLVNHFQGRVTCPLGHAAPTPCSPVNHGSECPNGAECVLSALLAPACSTGSDCAATAPGLTCASGICTCSASATVDGIDYFCEPKDTTPGSPNVLHAYVCHETNNCQVGVEGDHNADASGQPKDCCLPGTDTPVNVAVCGQCGSASERDADHAVYCTCKCCAPCCPAGVSGAEAIAMGCSTDLTTCGPACDPNVDYCTCPSGFACTAVVPNLGLPDEAAGAYCVKEATVYTGSTTCGDVGYAGSSCAP